MTFSRVRGAVRDSVGCARCTRDKPGTGARRDGGPCARLGLNTGPEPALAFAGLPMVSPTSARRRGLLRTTLALLPAFAFALAPADACAQTYYVDSPGASDAQKIATSMLNDAAARSARAMRPWNATPNPFAQRIEEYEARQRARALEMEAAAQQAQQRQAERAAEERALASLPLEAAEWSRGWLAPWLADGSDRGREARAWAEVLRKPGAAAWKEATGTPWGRLVESLLEDFETRYYSAYVRASSTRLFREHAREVAEAFAAWRAEGFGFCRIDKEARMRAVGRALEAGSIRFSRATLEEAAEVGSEAARVALLRLKAVEAAPGAGRP